MKPKIELVDLKEFTQALHKAFSPISDKVFKLLRLKFIKVKVQSDNVISDKEKIIILLVYVQHVCFTDLKCIKLV